MCSLTVDDTSRSLPPKSGPAAEVSRGARSTIDQRTARAAALQVDSSVRTSAEMGERSVRS